MYLFLQLNGEASGCAGFTLTHPEYTKANRFKDIEVKVYI